MKKIIILVFLFVTLLPQQDYARGGGSTAGAVLGGFAAGSLFTAAVAPRREVVYTQPEVVYVTNGSSSESYRDEEDYDLQERERRIRARERELARRERALEEQETSSSSDDILPYSSSDDDSLDYDF